MEVLFQLSPATSSTEPLDIPNEASHLDTIGKTRAWRARVWRRLGLGTKEVPTCFLDLESKELILIDSGSNSWTTEETTPTSRLATLAWTTDIGVRSDAARAASSACYTAASLRFAWVNSLAHTRSRILEGEGPRSKQQSVATETRLASERAAK